MADCYHRPMGTTTVRLPEPIKAEGEAFAASLGISFNALMAVALRDYLDGRSTPTPKSGERSRPAPKTLEHYTTPAPKATPQAVLQPASVAVLEGKVFRAPKSRSDPCPCGATTWDGHRLKWKHCHGKEVGV